MKIMSFALVPVLLLPLAACSPKGPPSLGEATVNVRNASLRSRDSSTSRTLRVLEPGMKVEILEQQGSWYRVRLGEMEGWMSASTLLTDAMRDHIQEGVNAAIGQVPQNTGTLARDANLRVDPGRNTAVLRTGS